MVRKQLPPKADTPKPEYPKPKTPAREKNPVINEGQKPQKKPVTVSTPLYGSNYGGVTNKTNNQNLYGSNTKGSGYKMPKAGKIDINNQKPKKQRRQIDTQQSVYEVPDELYKDSGFYNPKNDIAHEDRVSSTYKALDKQEKDSNKKGDLNENDLFQFNQEANKYDVIDYDALIKEKNAYKDDLNTRIYGSTNLPDYMKEQIPKTEEQIALMGELDETEKAISELERRKKYQEAVFSKYVMDEAVKNNDEETINEMYKKHAGYDDPWIAKRAENIGNIPISMASAVASTIDVVRDLTGDAYARELMERGAQMYHDGQMDVKAYNEFIDEVSHYADYEATQPGTVGYELRELSNQIAYDIQNGEDGLGKFVGQGLDSTANFLAQFLLLGEGGSLGMMSLQSASQKYFENLENGYSKEVALWNAVATGATSYLTEKIGMDNFSAIITGTKGSQIFGQMLHAMSEGKGTLSIVGASIMSQALAEGLEEGIEGNVDYILDSLMAKMYSGEPIPYDAGEIFYGMMVGAFSGGITGVGGYMMGGYNILVETREQYNALKNDIQTLYEIRNEALAKNEDVSDIDKALQVGESALRNYESVSQTVGKIEKVGEDINTDPTPAEAKQIVGDALIPNVERIAKTSLQNQELINRVNEVSQEFLYNKGINMDAKQFVAMDSKKRENLIANAEKVQQSCPHARIGYATEILDADGNNIMADNNAMVIKQSGEHPIIIVNPDGDTSAIVSAIHEIIHTIENTPEYKALFKTTFQSDEAFANKMDELTKEGGRYEGAMFDEAMYETVAITITEDMMHDEGAQAFIDHMAKYNTSTAYKMWYKFKDIMGLFPDNNSLGEITSLMTKALANQNKVYMEDGVAFDRGKTFTKNFREGLSELEKGNNRALFRYIPFTDVHVDPKTGSVVVRAPKWAKKIGLYNKDNQIAFTIRLGGLSNNLHDYNDTSTDVYWDMSHNDIREDGQKIVKNPIDRQILEHADILLWEPFGVFETQTGDKQATARYILVLKATDNKGYPIIATINGPHPEDFDENHVPTSFMTVDFLDYDGISRNSETNFATTFFGKNDLTGKKGDVYKTVADFLEGEGYNLLYGDKGQNKTQVLHRIRELQRLANNDTLSDSSISHLSGKSTIDPSVLPMFVKQQQVEMLEDADLSHDPIIKPEDIKDWKREINRDGIKTFEEAKISSTRKMTTEDFTEQDIQQALEDGYIGVYSAMPFETGAFVTPSKQIAQNYIDSTGKGELHEAIVYTDNVAWTSTLEGRYAPVGPEIKFSKKQLDTHLTNEVESYYDTIAPYLDTNLTKDNRQELVDMASKSYTNATNAIAQALGVDYVGRVENIGGYLNDEGKKLRELSWTHTLNTEPVKAKLFASLMGDLAFENQEAVISYRYLNDVNPSEIKVGAEGKDGGTNGVESIIKFNDVDKILDSLEKADIANYSIDRENNILRIQDFGFESDLSDKISQLVDDAIEGGNIDEEIEARAIYSYYLDRVSRQNLYLERLEGQNGQRGRGSSSLSEQARELVQTAYDRVADVINKKENGQESPFLRRNAEVRYSKFDPAKNKDMRDNLGNKINKNMANRITGTRLTDSQGRPLVLYHTSSSLFSEFDPRGTDYYHYGDKIVNFYSTDPDVSGSYAYDPRQIRSAEDYAKHEKAETESKRLRKELADTEEQYDARIYELQEQLFDYSRTKEFRSVISNAISSLEGYKFDNRLEDGFRQFQIEFLENLNNVNYPALWYQRFESLRNLAENSTSRDYPIDGYGDIFQSIVDSDEFKKMSEIYDQIQLTAEDKANSVAPIKGELRDYGRLRDSGKQYVGYGKALNPYILKNNSPNVNWSYLNDGDFDIDFQDYLSLQTELWNIFPKASEAELDEMMKSKNRINRFILSNVDDDIRALLIENPIILANITNMAKDSYYVDGYGSLWYDNEYEPTSMEQFVNNLDTKFAEAYDRADNSHLFTNSVTTNDVVTATLAVNDYTDNPYDGVVFENITDSASGEADDIVSDIVAMFESNQFKLMDNQNPTDNPDIRYSKKRRTDTQQSVSNEDNRYYDYGMNPARNVDIPRETEAGPTRRHANNMANSEWVSDEEAQRIVEAVESGDYAYAPVHFAEIDEQAKDTLRRIGKAKAMQEVTTDTENVTLEKAALARQLLAQMREDGQEGTPEYERLQRINSSFFTPSAQILAYGRWLRQSTPEGQIITIESEIARMQSELEQRWGDRAPDLVIPEELRREYIETKDEARRQAIREEIAQMIADKIPPTILEQLNSFRHLAMLFNPRTWTKNRLSNAIFGGIDELTRAIRSGLETVAKNYGDKHESSIFHGMELQAGAYNRFNEQERKLKKQFEQDYMDNFKQNISKYSNMDIGAFLSTSEFGEMVKDRRKSFSWELLNQLEKINKGEGKGWLKHLGLSDVPAMKNAYSKAMVGYFKKNNLDLNTVTDEQMKKARDFAFAEALYATFNTNNWLATQISDFERKADKKGRDVGAITRMAVESFIPFKRTPLNIIRTGYNYTTLGMVTNLARDLYLVKHGKMNANQMINHLAQGMTGTGLVALGMLLSRLGIFRTKDDDKDRKQYFDEDNGEQDYSLNFDGFSYTVDWLDPMVVPMAMGAEIAQAIDENGLSWDNALGIASSVADPIFETSMLSGISKNLQSYQKGTKEWYGEIAKNIARNYVSQYVPSAFGALARTVDDTRRNTYADPNNKNPFNSKFAKQIKNKLPGISMTNEPYINKQGQVEKNEDFGYGIAGRAFLNFISPGYYSTKDIDKYDEELYRLYDSTGDLNAFPSQASKDVTFDKETMKFTDKEYTEWQKKRWQTEAKYVNEFIDSDAYKNLSDDERLATIKDIREYAQKVAKKEFLEGRGKEYNNDKQLNNATSALESGIELYDYYDYLNNAGTKQADKIKYLEDMDLTQEQREQLYNLSGYKTSYQDAYNKSMKDKEKSTNKKSSSKKKSSGGSKKASGSKSKSGGGSKPSGTLKMGKSFKLANPTNLKLDTQKVNTNKYLSSYYNTMRGSKNVSSGSSGTVVCPRCGNRVSSATGKCPICGATL